MRTLIARNFILDMIIAHNNKRALDNFGVIRPEVKVTGKILNCL
jgi:hypothetical protein